MSTIAAVVAGFILGGIVALVVLALMFARGMRR